MKTKFSKAVAPAIETILQVAAKTDCYNPRDIMAVSMLVGAAIAHNDTDLSVSMKILALAERVDDDIPPKVSKTLELLAATLYMQEQRHGEG
jgi:hypothetical protein